MSSAAATTGSADATPSAEGWRAEWRATLLLGLPLVLTNVSQAGLMAIDVVLLGWLGPASLAAGTLGNNLFFGSFFFSMGLGSAVAPLVSQELGRRRHAVREVRRTVRGGFWAVSLSTLPTWLLLWNAETVLLWLGQDPGLAAGAGTYLRAMQWGIWPMALSVVLRGFLAAAGRPGWTLVVALLALPVNALLAWWWMRGGLGVPALGAVGVGLATVAVTVVSFLGLAAVALLDRRLRRYRLFGQVWQVDRARLVSVFRIGLPISATLVFEGGLFNGAAFAMGLFGAAALAAHAVALQVSAFCFMVPLGLAQAATVRVGHAYGRGDRDGIRRAGWAALVLGVGFMALVGLAQLLAPRALAGLFLDAGDPANAEVVRLAVLFLGVSALFAVADGTQAVGAGMLRGLGDTRTPMLLAGFGYWCVGAPVGLLLAFWTEVGAVGVWIGLATGLAVVAALMVARWVRRERLGLVGAAGKG